MKVERKQPDKRRIEERYLGYNWENMGESSVRSGAMVVVVG